MSRQNARLMIGWMDLNNECFSSSLTNLTLETKCSRNDFFISQFLQHLVKWRGGNISKFRTNEFTV